MGTRSTTRIYEIRDGASPSALKKLKPLLTLYRQFDGYPSGMGNDLGTFLKDMTIVNGISGDAKIGTHANGAGCLAAQLVKHLKETIGNVYICSPEDGIEQFNYYIYAQASDNWVKPVRSSLILVRVTDFEGKELFNGDVKAFAAWASTQAD